MELTKEEIEFITKLNEEDIKIDEGPRRRG
jgi:hypothetical protein